MHARVVHVHPYTRTRTSLPRKLQRRAQDDEFGRHERTSLVRAASGERPPSLLLKRAARDATSRAVSSVACLRRFGGLFRIASDKVRQNRELSRCRVWPSRRSEQAREQQIWEEIQRARDPLASAQRPKASAHRFNGRQSSSSPLAKL
eukprot:6191563-Pleurochrysis_carterae.AAC.1